MSAARLSELLEDRKPMPPFKFHKPRQHRDRRASRAAGGVRFRLGEISGSRAASAWLMMPYDVLLILNQFYLLR